MCGLKSNVGKKPTKNVTASKAIIIGNNSIQAKLMGEVLPTWSLIMLPHPPNILVLFGKFNRL